MVGRLSRFLLAWSIFRGELAVSFSEGGRCIAVTFQHTISWSFMKVISMCELHGFKKKSNSTPNNSLALPVGNEGMNPSPIFSNVKVEGPSFPTI